MFQLARNARDATPPAAMAVWCLLMVACGGGSPASPSGGTGNTAGSPALTKINVHGVAEVHVGSAVQLAAEAIYSDGSTNDVTIQAKWSSSATGVASVTSGGLVTGLAAGNATILASFEGQSGELAFHVASERYITGALELLRIECLGDCDDVTQGKGDFSYQIEFPPNYDGTASYPDASHVIRLGTGESYALVDLPVWSFTVIDLPGNSLELTFRATEWDQTILGRVFPDPDMNDRTSTASYSWRPGGDWIPDGDNYITLGSGSCRLRLHYRIVNVRNDR